jgi:hypothetical protein
MFLVKKASPAGDAFFLCLIGVMKFLQGLFYRDAVLGIDFLYFLDAAAVFFGRQRVRVHPGLDDFHGDGRSDDLAAEAEDVAVIVLARKGRAERVLADDGKNAAELVGNHCTAVADAVDKDAAVAFALGDSESRRIDKVRQVARLLIVRAKILDLMTFAFKICLDFVFELRAGMVVCHCNFHDDSSSETAG